jgi:signal transduction histidine kinase
MGTRLVRPESDQEVDGDALERDRMAGRALALLGAVLLPLWTPFDWVFTPDRWLEFGCARLACSTLLVCLAVAMRRPDNPTAVHALTFLSLGAVAGTVGWMMSVVTDAYLVYTVGFSLILWGSAMVLSYPAARMGALQLLLLGVAAALQLMHPEHRTPEDLVFAICFLITSAALCTAVSSLRLSALGQVLEAKSALSAVEMQMAEERASNLAKSAFLARMSHELRTPLNAILGYSELIGEELADAGVELVSDDLEHIRRASNHLLTLIDDILDLSRIEAGELVVEPATVTLTPILEDVLSELWGLAAKKRIHLQAEIAPDLGTLRTDPRRARQIVVNLVTNAIKFTDRGGVVLAANRTPEGVRIEVRDSGVGIAGPNLSRVFEPFVQVDGTPTRRIGGSGLGLAIVRDLAQLLGGRVSVASIPGAGSTFTVELVDMPGVQAT